MDKKIRVLTSVGYQTPKFTSLSIYIGKPNLIDYRYYNKKRAATCDFQQCGILISVDSDKPVQPPVKPRNSKLCSVSSLTVIEYSIH